jgi:hypothetical protein
MRITIYVHKEDLENLNNALNSENEMVKSIRILRNPAEGFIEVSLLYDEYVKCTDLGIFEELLSL